MADKIQQKKGGILKATAWVGSSRLFVKLLGLCSTFVLARLLIPADFGLVAVAIGIISLFEAFSELGFNHALVRFQDANDQDYSTAWTLNFLRGSIISVVVFCLSYPLSYFLDDNRLFPLLLVIALLPMIRGMENPRLIIFEKNLQFNVIFKVMLLTKLVGVITTIILALIWPSYWVLIVGMFVTDGMRCLLSYYYAPCKVNFTIKSWRRLIGFSGWISGATMLRALAQRLDPILLAAYATPHIVGVLHVAQELSNMAFLEVAAPVRRVIFPALSQYPPNSDAFLEIYKQSVSGLFTILAPVCLGFALTVPDLVPIVLGNQWLEVIGPIQWIMVFLTFSIVGQMSPSASLAVGKSRPLFFQSVLLTPIKLIVFIYCVSNYGLNGAVFSICLDLLLSTITSIYIGIKATGISFFRHLLLIKRSIIPLIIMSLSVLLISQLDFLSGKNLFNHIYRLLVLIPTGIISYSIVYLVLWQINGRPPGVETKIIELLLMIFRKNDSNYGEIKIEK